MPITSEAALAAFCRELRATIINSIDDVLEQLAKEIPPGRAKHNTLILLQSRNKELIRQDAGGILGFADLNLGRNVLRSDLLLFIDHLELADFSAERPTQPGLKPGHLLYQVPDQMQVQEQYACRIRIAQELEQLLESLPTQEHLEFKQVEVAKVMEVELYDPSGESNRAFHIFLVSDGTQFIDEYSYTEWVFYLRPLREGNHELVLKVSALIEVNGQERSKNLVLAHPITVVSTLAEAPVVNFARAVEPPVTEWADKSISEDRVAPRIVKPTDTGSTRSPRPAPTPPLTAESMEDIPPAQPNTAPPVLSPAPAGRRKSAGRRQWLSMAAGFLILLTGALWVVKPWGGPEGGGGTILNPADNIPVTGPDTLTAEHPDSTQQELTVEPPDSLQ